jgi:hypothetical protein
VTHGWARLVWRWPWITTTAAVVLLVSPPGQEVVGGAFFSRERLTRHLSLFLLAVVGSIMVAAALIEWFMRFHWLRHRARRRAEAALVAAPIGGKTET